MARTIAPARPLVQRCALGLWWRALLVGVGGLSLLSGGRRKFRASLGRNRPPRAGAQRESGRARDACLYERGSDAFPDAHDRVPPAIRGCAAERRAPPGKKPPETVTPDSGRKEVSLGDIARQYRREKLARQAQESAQFPLLLNAAPLAAPSLPVLPSNQPPDPQGTPRPEKSAQPKEFSPRIVAPDPLPHKEKLVPSRPVLKIAPSPAPIVPKPLAPKPLISESAGVQNESLRPSGGSARTPTRGLEAVSVRRGDSLWSLAAAYLGHGGRWKELLEENPWIEDPRRLGGSQVLLPIRVAAEELPGP